MQEVFPKVKDVLPLHKLARHIREALVEAIGLLPSLRLLLGTCKNPSVTVATAHWSTSMTNAVIQYVEKRR
jgi:hypothetical protein